MIRNLTLESDKININDICEYIFKYNDNLIINNYAGSYGHGESAALYIKQNIDKCFDRRKYLSDLISNYISEWKIFNVEGFIRFRLNEYRKKLCYSIDYLLNKYEISIEYEFYIDLIRKFIDTQNRMIYELNIVPKNNGYLIFDENNKNLNRICKEILEKEFSFTFENPDEFLLSSVITLAPIKVVTHKYNECSSRKIIKTLKNIYKQNFIPLL